MSILDRVKARAEELTVPAHPLLEQGMQENTKNAYFGGAVLAALLDDGQIEAAEEAFLRRLGLSLDMPKSEVAEVTASVKAIQGEDDQFAYLEEICGELQERDTAVYFLCDMAQVFGADGTLTAEDKEYLSGVGIMLKLPQEDIEYCMDSVTSGKEINRNDVASYLKTGQGLSKEMTFDLGNNVNVELVKLEPGTFLMGSPVGELGRSVSEVQHQVTLTKGFAIGKYPVTQAQYQAVMGSNPSHFKGNQRPVEKVSWDDAMAFCRKLNELTAHSRPAGYAFTLPTEAQWEYACRAGSTTALNNNSNLTTADGQDPNLDGVAWYDKNSGSQTHDVGGKAPNAWGLYDMHGNVWEWCLDWYDDYPTHAVTDPVGAASGSDRVDRGGSWYDDAQYCRSAFRSSYSPDGRNYYLGFRLVLASV